MEGNELLIALGRTTHNLKLLSPDGSTVLDVITVQQAIELASKGNYVGSGKGKKRQVKSIRKYLPGAKPNRHIAPGCDSGPSLRLVAVPERMDIGDSEGLFASDRMPCHPVRWGL